MSTYSIKVKVSTHYCTSLWCFKLLIGAGGSVSFPIEGSNVEGVLAVGIKAGQTTLCLIPVEDEHLWPFMLKVLLM